MHVWWAQGIAEDDSHIKVNRRAFVLNCFVLDAIKSTGCKVLAMITDNIHIKQAFFKLFHTVGKKPWKNSEEVFILFDYDHILKSAQKK